MTRHARILFLLLPLALASCWGPCNPGILGIFIPAPKPSPEETMWQARIASVRVGTPLAEVVAALGLGAYESRGQTSPDLSNPFHPPVTEGWVRYFVEGGLIDVSYDNRPGAHPLVRIGFLPEFKTPAENLDEWTRLQAARPKPIVGGDALERPFVLHGRMTTQELRQKEDYGFFGESKFQTPGRAAKYVFMSSDTRRIDAVYYHNSMTGEERCYYFDVTDVVITDPPAP